jgi:hypothetical protein
MSKSDRSHADSNGPNLTPRRASRIAAALCCEPSTSDVPQMVSQSRRSHDAVVLAVDDCVALESDPQVAEQVCGLDLELEGNRDRVSDAPDGQVTGELQGGAGLADIGADEGDLRVFHHGEEVVAARVRIALLVASVDAERLDGELAGRLGEVGVIEDRAALELVECAADLGDHRVLSRVPAADLVGLVDRHGNWKVVGESVLIDWLVHSAEWDRLPVDTWIDHGRRFEDLHRGRCGRAWRGGPALPQVKRPEFAKDSAGDQGCYSWPDRQQGPPIEHNRRTAEPRLHRSPPIDPPSLRNRADLAVKGSGDVGRR